MNNVNTSCGDWELKSAVEGLPWGPSRYESALECGGHLFDPWSEKTPDAAEQLSPWAATSELVL